MVGGRHGHGGLGDAGGSRADQSLSRRDDLSAGDEMARDPRFGGQVLRNHTIVVARVSRQVKFVQTRSLPARSKGPISQKQK